MGHRKTILYMISYLVITILNTVAITDAYITYIYDHVKTNALHSFAN